MAYPVFANALPIVKLAHDPLQFLLQAKSPRALLGGGHWQSDNPFLKHCPHGGACTTRLDDVEIVLLCISPVGHKRGLLRGCRAAAVAGKDSVPLGQLASNAAENGWCDQILVTARLTTDESIEETVVETSEERRREAAAGEEGVGRGFSYKDTGLL